MIAGRRRDETRTRNNAAARYASPGVPPDGSFAPNRPY
jgi:hypothetical protein